MIRLFNVYYPTRTLMLLLCEAFLVGGSFLLATTYLIGPDTYIALIYENGIFKILGITVLTLLLSYYFDLYEPQRISGRWEIYFRLLLVLSVLSFILAGLVYLIPDTYIGPHVFTVGISILAIVLVLWRRVYEWIMGFSTFQERVYVLGGGLRIKFEDFLGMIDRGVERDGRLAFALHRARHRDAAQTSIRGRAIA